MRVLSVAAAASAASVVLVLGVAGAGAAVAEEGSAATSQQSGSAYGDADSAADSPADSPADSESDEAAAAAEKEAAEKAAAEKEAAEKAAAEKEAAEKAAAEKAAAEKAAAEKEAAEKAAAEKEAAEKAAAETPQTVPTSETSPPATSADPAPAADPTTSTTTTTAPPTTTTTTSSPTTTTPAPAPAIGITVSAKQTDTNGSGRRDAGDTVTYTYTVTNTGNTTLTGVAVSDVATTGITCSPTTLPAGDAATCTGTRVLTQGDLDEGHRNSSATVTAKDQDSGETVSAAQALSVPLAQARSLGLRQSVTASTGGDGKVDAGDRLTYRFTVTNTGTVTVRGVKVNDSLLKRFGVAVSCSATTLAPGASATCTSGAFTVTKTQANAGKVVNTATATGVAPDGATVRSGQSTLTTAVRVPTKPSVGSGSGKGGTTTTTKPKTTKPKTVKAVARLRATQYVAAVKDVNGNGALDKGDSVTFGFAVRNTGTLSVYGLHIDSPKLDRLDVAVSCNASTLVPGASTTCLSEKMVVSAFQAKNGIGKTFAKAVGRTSGGSLVTSNSTSTDIGRAVPAVGNLAMTGADAMAPVRMAGGLLAGGIMFLLFARTRPRRLVPSRRLSEGDPYVGRHR